MLHKYIYIYISYVSMKINKSEVLTTFKTTNNNKEARLFSNSEDFLQNFNNIVRKCLPGSTCIISLACSNLPITQKEIIRCASRWSLFIQALYLYIRASSISDHEKKFIIWRDLLTLLPLFL